MIKIKLKIAKNFRYYRSEKGAFKKYITKYFYKNRDQE